MSNATCDAEQNQPKSADRVLTTGLDRALAPMMFWVSFTFLIIVGGTLYSRQVPERLLQYSSHDDGTAVASAGTEIPDVDGLATTDADQVSAGLFELADDRTKIQPVFYFSLALLAVWPLFWFEWFLHWATGGNFAFQRLLYCVCPPLRMGMRDHVDGRSIWLPRIGWAPVDFELQTRIERAFSGPMIMMALAVLPLLALEYCPPKYLGDSTWQVIVVMVVGEMVIWIAFALELIVMISIVPKRLRYCREHWIDLAIVCLPVVGFLRILRFGRMLRLHHVTKVGRVYRLRGVGLRMFRGVLLLDVMHKVVEGNPQRKLDRLREQLTEREREIQQLKTEIDKLEAKLHEE